MPAHVEGLDNVLQNIRNLLPAETAKMNARLAAAGTVVEAAVKNHASLTDHSLAELAKMGHPYSRRHPTDSGPHPDDVVHQQSGLLAANIEKHESLGGPLPTVEIGVSEGNVPYIGALINGTPRMRPRNFIGAGFRDALDEVIAITNGK